MLQPKDIDWLNGYKNKTHVYAVYNRPTSDLRPHKDWKWGDGRSYSKQMEINEEDMKIVDIYAPSIGAPQYIRQILTAIKGEIDSNTIIVGDLNNPTYTNGQIIQNENK